MHKSKKSTALYPHPFSKAYWRDAAAELKDTRMLVFAALMIAIRVALKLVYIPLAPNLRINTAFVANAIGAMVFGPVVAIPAAIVSDFLGWVIHPEGAYFLPFVLTEVAGSVLFALFLYRAKVGPIRIMLSRFSICLLVNILLQTPLMMLYYSIYMGGKLYVLTIPHILKNLFMFPIESFLLTLLMSMVLPVMHRMQLIYSKPEEDALKFTPKSIAALVIMFAVGAGAVFGYLFYHYANTSLSADYTAEQRYEANTAMTKAIVDSSDDYDDVVLVTTVESAYKQFMKGKTTYNVAVYVVDEEALAGYDKDLETIRGMSKSKAKAVSEDGVMQSVATAQIVLNNKTGAVEAFGLQQK